MVNESNQQHQIYDSQGAEKGQPPLQGIRVLELGSFVAAPLATRILADFGAEVIKVEAPGRGDELRQWGTMVATKEGHISTWWLVQARNKRLITLDLHQAKGQAVALQLVKECDIVIENFRPGRLEQWNLGYEQMCEVNPGIILVHISGYGQTGPYSERAGYGNVGESMGGIRYVTGYPDRPPVRVGVSLGDALAAQQAAFGAIMTLRARDRDGYGQEVDVAITESVFALTESMLTEYMHLGIVRERRGNSFMRAAPSNVYFTADKHWLSIGGNGDNVFRRLARAMGQPELAQDDRFCNNQARVTHYEELDQIISAWVGSLSLAELQSLLDEAGVPAGPVMNIADIADDPQYRFRGMIASVPDERLPQNITYMPGIVPHLTRTPGTITHSGGNLGADNESIYADLLGLRVEEIEQMMAEGVI
jgi:formyl-CoA transferase